MYNIAESASKHRPLIENIIGDRVWQSLNKMSYFCHVRNNKLGLLFPSKTWDFHLHNLRKGE